MWLRTRECVQTYACMLYVSMNGKEGWKYVWVYECEHKGMYACISEYVYMCVYVKVSLYVYKSESVSFLFQGKTVSEKWWKQSGYNMKGKLKLISSFQNLSLISWYDSFSELVELIADLSLRKSSLQ